jgi:hypothetical protein
MTLRDFNLVINNDDDLCRHHHVANAVRLPMLRIREHGLRRKRTKTPPTPLPEDSPDYNL